MNAKRGTPDGSGQCRQSRQPTSAPVVRPWLWFRPEPGARSSAEEEFLSLPAVGQAGLGAVITRYRRGETRPGDVAPVADGILELRHRHDTVRFRVLFIQWGRSCIGLTAFCKKERTTPRPDLDRARARARRWRAANGAEPPR
jgi:phage-related protein